LLPRPTRAANSVMLWFPPILWMRTIWPVAVLRFRLSVVVCVCCRFHCRWMDECGLALLIPLNLVIMSAPGVVRPTASVAVAGSACAVRGMWAVTAAERVTEARKTPVRVERWKRANAMLMEVVRAKAAILEQLARKFAQAA